MTNPNVLSQRYATEEMNAIFSEEGKALMERDLWLAVLRAQRELGLDVPKGVVERYEESRGDVDLDLIKEIELRTRHDVKAKIEAYNAAAGGVEYIHLGMTSRDLTDNVEQLQAKRAATLALGKYASVLRHLIDKAEEYRHVEIAARTHHQAAQPTLLGRRFAMWAEKVERCSRMSCSSPMSASTSSKRSTRAPSPAVTCSPARTKSAARATAFMVTVLPPAFSTTTGIGMPFSTPCVLALKALQNSMMFTPCCPRAGPTGGLGLASWALT